MIETIKDLKHSRTSYESLKPSCNSSMSHLHSHNHHSSHSHPHPEFPTFSDSLNTTKAAVISNASAIYGPTRSLDIITYASTHSRKITAAIVEHAPHGRSYIHCCSAAEDTRLAAVEHLLVITEDILHRLMDKEGIASSGWLPATPQSQHAASYSHGSMPNLMRWEITGSSKASTPSVAMPERQAISGPPQQQGMSMPQHRDLVVAPQQQGVPMSQQRDGGGAPQQQVMGPPQQAVAPQPTRAGRVQWIMGSEG
ncbi:hypothetical protein K458DRAFT_366736 [Lentithecium fluviatile CBS 122367]|uniref:Uncharacterized protein n=1 Tax=Lentithecium fluviatile CBS 122367 TaxID=1168545 RepID=A0A6G1J2E4_9PLEO|nr:hypothetical protein K458DRAFT_366736 [Lentithecium fluviatile CBS 122367]